MNEWIIMGLVISGAAGFAIGGTGFKYVRRFILPAIWCIMLLAVGYSSAYVVALTAMIVFSLGYGEHTPVWVRALVGISFSLPSMWLGLSWWQVVVPIVFLSLYWLSLKKGLQWKIVELMTGAIIGCSLVR